MEKVRVKVLTDGGFPLEELELAGIEIGNTYSVLGTEKGVLINNLYFSLIAGDVEIVDEPDEIDKIKRVLTDFVEQEYKEPEFQEKSIEDFPMMQFRDNDNDEWQEDRYIVTLPKDNRKYRAFNYNWNQMRPIPQEPEEYEPTQEDFVRWASSADAVGVMVDVGACAWRVPGHSLYSSDDLTEHKVKTMLPCPKATEESIEPLMDRVKRWMKGVEV